MSWRQRLQRSVRKGSGSTGSNVGAGEKPTGEQVERALAEAVRLGIEEGPSPRARAATTKAIALAQQRVTAEGDAAGPQDLRRLGRALYRGASLDAFVGNLVPARQKIGEAVALAERALSGVDPSEDVHDAMVAEAASTAADAARLAAAAGDTTDHDHLLGQARELAGRSDGPRSRRAQGTVAYAQASAKLSALVKEAQRAQAVPSQAALADVIQAALGTVQIRRAVVDEDDETTRFDLAEALALHGQALALSDQMSEAIGALAEAQSILDRFTGEAPAALTAQVGQQLEGLRRMTRRQG